MRSCHGDRAIATRHIERIEQVLPHLVYCSPWVRVVLPQARLAQVLRITRLDLEPCAYGRDIGTLDHDSEIMSGIL